MSKPSNDRSPLSRGMNLAAGDAIAPPALAGGPGAGCCGEHASAHAERSGETHNPAASVSTGSLLVDLGNTKCPVMGGTTDGKTYSEWNGLRVGHCCGGCASKFAADPERYLNDAKIAWREAADSAKAVDVAQGADRAKALSAVKKKWTVVGEPAAGQPTR